MSKRVLEEGADQNHDDCMSVATSVAGNAVEELTLSRFSGSGLPPATRSAR